jgi:hypothetical protein
MIFCRALRNVGFEGIDGARVLQNEALMAVNSPLGIVTWKFSRAEQSENWGPRLWYGLFTQF